MTAPLARRTGRRTAGFSLIETAIVMVVIGLILAGASQWGGSVIRGDRDRDTQARLDRIERALADHVIIHGALPCPTQVPSTGGQPTGLASGPQSNNRCVGEQVRGVVPWRPLGLAVDDVLDGYGRFITYRVYDHETTVSTEKESLVKAGALNMRFCDSSVAANADTSVNADSCPEGGGVSTEEFLRNKGISLRVSAAGAFVADRAAGTGAAYVLISHGADGALAYDSQGQQVPADGNATTEEAANAPTVAWVPHNALMAPPRGNFDDIVRWRTILQLAEAAGMGPGAPPAPGAAAPTPTPTEQPVLAQQAVAVPITRSALLPFLPTLPNNLNNYNSGVNAVSFQGGTIDTLGGNVGIDNRGIGVWWESHYGGNPAEIGGTETLGISFDDHFTRARIVMSLFNGQDRYVVSFFTGSDLVGRVRLSPHSGSAGGQGSYFVGVNAGDLPFDRIEFRAENTNTSSFVHQLNVCPAVGDVCDQTPTGLSSANNHAGVWTPLP